jgi:hypothetical protein
MYHKPIVGTTMTIQMYDLLFHIKPSEIATQILNISLCYTEDDACKIRKTT